MSIPGEQKRGTYGLGPNDLDPKTKGMTYTMALAVTKLLRAARGRIWIVSGFRTYDQQSALYQKYLNGTGNLAAKPGTSRHESGNAVDFGGDRNLLKTLAPKFGLKNTVPSEWWHYSVGGEEGGGHAHGNPAATAGAGGGGGVTVNPAVGQVADPGPATLPKNATEAQIIKFINDNYGTAARAMLGDPELRKALISAAQAGAEGERFMEYIKRTKWWKSRSEAMRTWDMLGMSDPKEQKDRLEKRKATLKPLFEQLGLDGDVGLMALAVERLGLNQEQLNASAASMLTTESKATGLDEGTLADLSADGLMRIARMEYLTPIDRQTAERWAIKGVRLGAEMEDQFRAYMSNIASARFGIDPNAGIAPADVMSPVKMAIAESLEINPEAIDLLSEDYNEVLQVETKEGTYRPMTAAEATVWARSKEQFKGTKTAEQATASLVESLGKTFGKVA